MVNCGEERTKCYGRSCLMPKYRSKFEEQVCGKLTQQKIKFKYEPIIIEIKGRLTKQDRFKHLYIQKQKPELDIRFVLQNYKVKLYKGSKTTYGEWLNKNKFLWHEKTIPLQWINEPRKENKRQHKNIKHLSDSHRSINGEKL